MSLRSQSNLPRHRPSSLRAIRLRAVRLSLALGLLTLWCAAGAWAASPPRERSSGQTAPDGVAIDQNGDEQRWAAPFDGVTLVDFAASWCGPCRHSLPRLEAFAAAHPGLQVLVVSVDEEVAGAEKLIESLDLKLPVVWDAGHRIASHYRPPAMPSSFLLRADGTILHTAEGSSEAEWLQLERSVLEALRTVSQTEATKSRAAAAE